MTIPERLPGLRQLAVLVAVFAAVWVPLEGVLWQLLLLAVGATAVLLGLLVQRIWGGRRLVGGGWLAATAVAGALFGGGTAVVGLLLMVLKTGLHSHGPEFSVAEINWLAGQIPLWTAAGGLAGLGLGMLWLAMRGNHRQSK